MTTRLIDVLTEDEKVLDRRVIAMKDLLVSVNTRVSEARQEHERVCKRIERDKKAHEVLILELKGLGAMKVSHGVRTSSKDAKEEYKARKPDRYDVSVMEVPNHQRGGTITFFVKMYWGNQARILYEGTTWEAARALAQKIADLTGQGDFPCHRVPAKKNLFDI